MIDLSRLNLPETEEKILKAAIAVFSKKGFDAATTGEVARQAGLAEGTIFRYFKTKKGLLHAILISMIKLLGDTLVLKSIKKILDEDTSGDIKQILKKIMYDRIELVESIFPMARIVVTQALFHEDIREEIYRSIILKARNIFSEIYKGMKARGILRDNMDMNVVGRNIIGNIVFFILQYKLFSKQLKVKNVDRELDKIIDVILFGIVKPEKIK
jgi:AcrR family transcriptional regulator